VKPLDVSLIAPLAELTDWPSAMAQFGRDGLDVTVNIGAPSFLIEMNLD